MKILVSPCPYTRTQSWSYWKQYRVGAGWDLAAAEWSLPISHSQRWCLSRHSYQIPHLVKAECCKTTRRGVGEDVGCCRWHTGNPIVRWWSRRGMLKHGERKEKNLRMKEDGSCWGRMALMEKRHTQLQRFLSIFMCDNSCELFTERIYIFSNNSQFSVLLLLMLLLLEAVADLGALLE